MRLTALTLAAVAAAVSGCANLDAAHIAGQEKDRAKYGDYSDVELQKQVNVGACFEKATTDNQIAYCALMGTATGMASTFGGRPTATAIAPTTGQVIKGTAEAIAPYAAAVGVARSVAGVQSKDPIIANPTPTIVRPEVVNPVIVNSVAP